MSLINKLIKSNEKYDNFDNKFTEAERSEQLLPPIDEQIEKTTRFFQSGSPGGISEADVTYYAGVLTRLNEARDKVVSAAVCTEEEARKPENKRRALNEFGIER